MCNFTTIIDRKNYVDGYSRAFAPYKGWFIVGEKGNVIPDKYTRDDPGPLTIIADSISHGNWHTLYNLIGKAGKKILVKGVRSIKHFREGYYLLRDNNEDELINRGDVKGGFRACDYEERANIVFDDGRLLSNEWYDDVRYSGVIGQFLIKKGAGWTILDTSENKLIESSFESVYPLCGSYLVSYQNGCYSIVGSAQKLTSYCFDSVMWADSGVWGMNILYQGNKKHYFHGEGGPIIFYAHEVLINNSNSILFGKGGVWYLYDGVNKPNRFCIIRQQHK